MATGKDARPWQRKDPEMNKLHRHLLTAGLLAGVGLAALAQPQPVPAPQAGPGPRMMAPGEHRGMMDGRFQQFREQRMAQRFDEFKRILQITPQQEGNWSAWTTALRPAQRQRFDRVEFARMTTPERIDRMRALRAQRNAEMDRKLDATKSFYATLTPDQKRLFDAESPRLLRGARGGHGHGEHGGHFGHRG
jgi:periplasmic protein CpxP/Spy